MRMLCTPSGKPAWLGAAEFGDCRGGPLVRLSGKLGERPLDAVQEGGARHGAVVGGELSVGLYLIGFVDELDIVQPAHVDALF